MDDFWEFTCKKCNCHDLIVTRFFDLISEYHRVKWREWGSLDDYHQWEYDEGELIERETDWEIEGSFPEGEELDLDSVEFFVNCADCDREIEFGWSHPDRMGRIWPAECSDFNPWKSWPEPRYRENWKNKNWLRPGTE